MNVIDTRWLKAFSIMLFTKVYLPALLLSFFISQLFINHPYAGFFLMVCSLLLPIFILPFIEDSIEKEYSTNERIYEEDPLTIGERGFPLAQNPTTFLMGILFYFAKEIIRRKKYESFRHLSDFGEKPFRMGPHGVLAEKHSGFSDNGINFFIVRSGLLSRFFLPEMPQRVSEEIYTSGLEAIGELRLITCVVCAFLVTSMQLAAWLTAGAKAVFAIYLASAVIISLFYVLYTSGRLINLQLKLLKEEARIRAE